jgi:zeaxanthin glucosyltransferase
VHWIHMLDFEKRTREADLGFIPIAAKDLPLGTLAQQHAHVNTLKGMSVVDYYIETTLELAKIELRELPSILREKQFDLLLVDSVKWAVIPVCEYVGVPTITVDLLPPVIDEASCPPFIFGWSYSEWQWSKLRNWLGNRIWFNTIKPLTRLVEQQRAEWGLPPLRSKEDLYSKRLRIAQIPKILDFPRQWLPATLRYTGPFASTESRPEVAFPWDKLNVEKALVYASLGTLNNSAVETFSTIATAFATLNVQLVLTTGGGLSASSLSNLDGDVIVVEQAPQLQLIPRATIVVTHAGINTALESLLHGKPMIAIPQAADQPGIAARLERAGVAERISMATLTVELLRATAVKVMNNSSYRVKAEAMQAHLKETRGLEMAVKLVEDELKSISAN